MREFALGLLVAASISWIYILTVAAPRIVVPSPLRTGSHYPVADLPVEAAAQDAVVRLFLLRRSIMDLLPQEPQGKSPLPTSSTGSETLSLQSLAADIESVEQRLKLLFEPQNLDWLRNARLLNDRFDSVDGRISSLGSLRDEVEILRREGGETRGRIENLLVTFLCGLGALVLALIAGFAYIARRLADNVTLVGHAPPASSTPTAEPPGSARGVKKEQRRPS